MPPFEVVITHLELTPADFKPKRVDRPDVSFSHVTPPMPALNRFFYMTVGGPWFWMERRSWTVEKWSERLSQTDRFETWILAIGGVPAGYVELQRLAPEVVEIDYLGLIPSVIGGGLGAHLLSSAVDRALAMGASQVLLNTCNLDHPRARANYEARGFKAVRTETKKREIPANAPGPWDGADSASELLRHAVAVVAYRGAKALRDAPPDFAQFRVGPSTREPLGILAHVNDLYDWALWLAKGEWIWNNSTPGTWDEEVARFHAGLEAFDAYLKSNAPLGNTPELLVSGPIADSLTHIGQINMLRRLTGAAVKGESYAKAEIVAGRLGAEQAPPRYEFD